jgi:three-Cys-motif partner protein
MPDYLQPEDDGLPMREAGAWAAEKLDYLARYINVFETAMRGIWKTRYYVDLMAGPGKNVVRGSKAVLLGSPLLALTTPHPFTGYFFVESSEDGFQALKQRCDASPYSKRVTMLTGDCNVLVTNIVQCIKRDDQSSLNLAFLDPEGFELRWETIAALASVRRMDLIINYTQGGLNRLMRRALEQKGQTIIDQFFGGREWRSLYQAWQSGKFRSGLHRKLIDLYKEKLKDLGYNEVVGGDEVLQTEPLMRNTRRAPLYRLLFASKSKRGNDFWQKVTRRDVHGQAKLW